MLYFPYEFSFVRDLVQWVKHHISDEQVFDSLLFKLHDGKNSSFVPKEQRLDLDHIVNPELRKLNLPMLQFFHIFIWPPHSGGYYNGDNRDIHLDLYPHLKNQKQTAYNVPVQGFDEDCFFEWYHGDYTSRIVVAENNAKSRNKVVFDWKDGPHLLDQIVQTKPYFVTINKPHRVRTGKNTRVMASLRFEKELSVKDYHHALVLKGR